MCLQKQSLKFALSVCFCASYYDTLSNKRSNFNKNINAYEYYNENIAQLMRGSKIYPINPLSLGRTVSKVMAEKKQFLSIRDQYERHRRRRTRETLLVEEPIIIKRVCPE